MVVSTDPNGNTEFEPSYDDGTNVKERASKWLANLNQHGSTVPGVSPSNKFSPAHVPVWYDPTAFKHAQQLHRTYAILIRFSEFYGLMLALNLYEGLAPLLVTGKSRTVADIFDRYVSTMVHVRNWYLYDPFDPESKSFKSLKMVRGLHHQVGSAINRLVPQGPPPRKTAAAASTGEDEALRSSDANKRVWMSQREMAGAQFTFMGFMALFGKDLGFHHFSRYDWHCVFHFWRVIGHCLGIEDRFNLCASESDEEIVQICRQLFFNEWLPHINAPTEPKGVAMAKGIATAMSCLSPTINYNALLCYAAPFMGLRQGNYPLANWLDRTIYWVLWIGFRYLFRSALFCWLGSRLVELRLWRTIARREDIRASFEQKFKGESPLETDQRCPIAAGRLPFNYNTALKMKLY